MMSKRPRSSAAKSAFDPMNPYAIREICRTSVSSSGIVPLPRSGHDPAKTTLAAITSRSSSYAAWASRNTRSKAWESTRGRNCGKLVATNLLVGRRKQPLFRLQHAVHRPEQPHPFGELALATRPRPYPRGRRPCRLRVPNRHRRRRLPRNCATAVERSFDTERDVPLVMEGPFHDHVHLSTAFPPAK